MKKNKTMAYALAASLLVGGTFLGTKALFKDQLNTVGELAISTGDVDIEVIPNAEGTLTGWQLDRNGAELSDGTNVGLKNPDSTTGTIDEADSWEGVTATSRANNLKPGDVLTKTVTIQNKGTLVAELDLTSNGKLQEKLGALSGLITATGTINDEDKTLAPGETTTLTLQLVVGNKGGQHIKQEPGKETTDVSNGYNTDGIENHKVDLNNAWVLTATQQNTKLLPNE